MEAQQKTITPARLIASGIIRYYKLEIANEVDQSLEILAGELAQITAQEEVLTIRGYLKRYGLQVPDVSPTVQPDGQPGLETTSQYRDSEAS